MINKYSDLSERDKQVTLIERMDAAKTAIENMSAGGLIGYSIDENGKASKGDVNFKLPSNFKDLDNYAFYHALDNSSSITSADLSSLTKISGSSGASYMFGACHNLTSVDLSSLTEISGSSGAYYIFSECYSLTSADLSSLTEISGSNGAAYMFKNCSSLTSVDLSSLTKISVNNAVKSMFQGCTSLKELRFPALTADSFGSITNQFSGLLISVTGCTLHFPAATQAKIETLTGYPNFGGTNTTVLFDL